MFLNVFIHISSIFCIFIFRPTFSMPKNEITYGGNVSPPGLYKIVVWAGKILPELHKKCLNIFKTVTRKIFQKERFAEIVMQLFVYKKGIALENLSDCFEHFSSAQTNNDGEFALKLSNNLNDTIFVHIFPLDEEKHLIPSASEPGIILQNKLIKQGWKQLENSKDVLYLYHFSERNLKISQFLDKWLDQNAMPSREEAFLLIASFRDITEKLVQLFTTKRKFLLNERQLLDSYEKAFTSCVVYDEKNLVEKLAQIDGMKKLLNEFCSFLGYGNKDEEIPINEDIDINLKNWRNFCKKMPELTVVAQQPNTSNGAGSSGVKKASQQTVKLGKTLSNGVNKASLTKGKNVAERTTECQQITENVKNQLKITRSGTGVYHGPSGAKKRIGTGVFHSPSRRS